jgi:hypothetical protein
VGREMQLEAFSLLMDSEFTNHKCDRIYVDVESTAIKQTLILRFDCPFCGWKIRGLPDFVSEEYAEHMSNHYHQKSKLVLVR